VQLRDLGPPPEDSLAVNEWAFRALAMTMYQAMEDNSLSEVDRRKEVRETASAMRGLIPQARLRAAEDAIQGDKAELNHGVGPEMEDAPQLTTSSGRPKAKRGRPRKRTLL
jgi:hypothetical protein